jgi:NADPH:quinone reductase-like Zn-dependent oxidoreductase
MLGAMRSVVIRRPGGHKRLVMEELPDPSPGPGEILVATEAIGVNYADCIVRMGLYASRLRVRREGAGPGG